MIQARYFVLLLFSYSFCLHTQERITSFVSTILVREDGSMQVEERIDIVGGQQIFKHGLVREFPLHYKNSYGFNVSVKFEIQSITHNGNRALYFEDYVANGVKIYIGDKHKLLQPGKHTYVITYETNRQLGFFSDHDELYWNVTGCGWCVPIDQASAHVTLPASIPLQSVFTKGFTGYYGSKAQNYRASIENSIVSFAATCLLKPHQGLTICVGFPKGLIQKPSLWQKIAWFIFDNMIVLLVFVFLLLFALGYIWSLILAQRANKPGTIIPLFYPPDDLYPSQIGCLKTRKLSNGAVSADIVHLAIRGFITISYEPGVLYGGTYTLQLNEQAMQPGKEQSLSEYDSEVLSALFANSNSITLTERNRSEIDQAEKTTQEFCSKVFDIYITTITIFFFKVYTPSGRLLQDKIDGFELYLKTAEIDRMKTIGTPPVKTPELYEAYLPYAMALGVECLWSDQFTSVFENLAAQGIPYVPRWYVGKNVRLDRLASDLNSSFSKAIISASKSAPGGVSGFSGGGKSGGGGGGGGGGGW